MELRLASWNINSVRLRLEQVLAYLAKFNIDILCLQETKCPDDCFPLEPFAAQGYRHVALLGQKSYNGVAILSKIPFLQIDKHNFCAKQDCRHLRVLFEFAGRQLSLHNFYVPAGGDIPDPLINDKFAHKLDFLRQMREFLTGAVKDNIIVGDLNVAPLECDVWSHKQLLNIVSHTKIERELLLAIQNHVPFIDIVRQKWPAPQKLFSWWSYRARDWQKSDRGRRLDHIWTSMNLAKYVKDVVISKELRGGAKPSDHVPIYAAFAW